MKEDISYFKLKYSYLKFVSQGLDASNKDAADVRNCVSRAARSTWFERTDGSNISFGDRSSL